MKTLAVGVVFVLVGSPLAGVVVLFSRIPAADLASGFKALAFAGATAVIVLAIGWATGRVIEAWQPKADIHTQIDARRQYAIDNRKQQATLQTPMVDDEQLTPMQAYLFREVKR